MNTIKKMLGMVLVTSFVFFGGPLLVTANVSDADPCLSGSYDAAACAASGGVPAAAGNTQTNSGGALSGSTAPSGSVSGLSVNTQVVNLIKYDTFSEFAAAVIETAVKVLMPFIVLAFMYSGFLFVKAQGNETELVEAKAAIWYSVIGAFILLGAWGFAQIIGETMATITV